MQNGSGAGLDIIFDVDVNMEPFASGGMFARIARSIIGSRWSVVRCDLLLLL